MSGCVGWGGAHGTVCMCVSEASLRDPVFSSHHVDPGNQTWAIRSGHKHSVSHIAAPSLIFYNRHSQISFIWVTLGIWVCKSLHQPPFKCSSSIALCCTKFLQCWWAFLFGASPAFPGLCHIGPCTPLNYKISTRFSKTVPQLHICLLASQSTTFVTVCSSIYVFFFPVADTFF